MSLQTHGGHASETGFVKMDPVFFMSKIQTRALHVVT